MQWRAMSCNNETVRLTVKMHTAGLFLSTDCTQRYAKSRSEGTIGMQSLRSSIHNFDKGARTSIRVSERRQPLVFWESVPLWLCYLWPSLNSRTNKLFAWTRGGNIASWTRMTQLGVLQHVGHRLTRRLYQIFISRFHFEYISVAEAGPQTKKPQHLACL